MGKRSTFDRNPRDFYPTPPEAVEPLIDHLIPGATFAEPCAGNGALVDELERHGFICTYAADIEPQREYINRANAFETSWGAPLWPGSVDYIITNPPWDRPTLHAMIEAFRVKTTWLLFDADWVHTKQAIPYLPRLRTIVSVGRVKWIPDSPYTGKDNCAWHFFDTKPGPIEFIGRTE